MGGSEGRERGASGKEAGGSEHPGTLSADGGWVGGSGSHGAATTGRSRGIIPLCSPVNRGLSTPLLKAMGLPPLPSPPSRGWSDILSSNPQLAWSFSACLSVCLAAALPCLLPPGSSHRPVLKSWLPALTLRHTSVPPGASDSSSAERVGWGVEMGCLLPRGLVGKKSFIEQNARLVPDQRSRCSECELSSSRRPCSLQGRHLPRGPASDLSPSAEGAQCRRCWDRAGLGSHRV